MAKLGLKLYFTLEVDDENGNEIVYKGHIVDRLKKSQLEKIDEVQDKTSKLNDKLLELLERKTKQLEDKENAQEQLVPQIQQVIENTENEIKEVEAQLKTNWEMEADKLRFNLMVTSEQKEEIAELAEEYGYGYILIKIFEDVAEKKQYAKRS